MTDDAALLRRTAQGDADAFDVFVGGHEASVMRYVRAMTGGGASAEDALQETFIAAWRAAGSFRGEGSARAWLLAIARHAVQRQFRRHAGEPASHVPLEELALQAGWGAEQGPDLATRLADRQRVQRALDRLDTEDREVLLLREVEGFSGQEVAATLGIGVPAMKSRLHRARLRFVAALKGDLHARA